jgi:hypothetical protein
MPPDQTPNTWSGDQREWVRRLDNGIVESVSVHRSVQDAEAGGRWDVRIHLHVGA